MSTDTLPEVGLTSMLSHSPFASRLHLDSTQVKGQAEANLRSKQCYQSTVPENGLESALEALAEAAEVRRSTGPRAG